MEEEVKIPRCYSCAYHQHQNSVAETLWARLSPLVSIFLTTPWLGHDFWAEAYANENIRRRPSYANDYHAVPMVLSTGSARTDILKSWGSVCYVHDEKAKGFTVKGRKGCMIGLSQSHTDGVYDVYMCDV